MLGNLLFIFFLLQEEILECFNLILTYFGWTAIWCWIIFYFSERRTKTTKRSFLDPKGPLIQEIL